VASSAVQLLGALFLQEHNVMTKAGIRFCHDSQVQENKRAKGTAPDAGKIVGVTRTSVEENV
jgi:hypothetical protein